MLVNGSSPDWESPVSGGADRVPATGGLHCAPALGEIALRPKYNLWPFLL